MNLIHICVSSEQMTDRLAYVNNHPATARHVRIPPKSAKLMYGRETNISYCVQRMLIQRARNRIASGIVCIGEINTRHEKWNAVQQKAYSNAGRCQHIKEHYRTSDGAGLEAVMTQRNVANCWHLVTQKASAESRRLLVIQLQSETFQLVGAACPGP